MRLFQEASEDLVRRRPGCGSRLRESLRESPIRESVRRFIARFEGVPQRFSVQGVSEAFPGSVQGVSEVFPGGCAGLSDVVSGSPRGSSLPLLADQQGPIGESVRPFRSL